MVRQLQSSEMLLGGDAARVLLRLGLGRSKGQGLGGGGPGRQRAPLGVMTLRSGRVIVGIMALGGPGTAIASCG